MDLQKLTHVMRRLALEAGDKIMEIYASDDFDVRSKSDQSPVTEADEAADAIISAGLRAEFPDLPLVTEEQAASHEVEAKTFLIVDPLDGTKEFLSRNGEFTVNIALIENHRPVLGVVHVPVTGVDYFGLAAMGAWKAANPDETGSPIRVAPRSRAPIQRLADLVSSWFVPGVIAAAIAGRSCRQSRSGTSTARAPKCPMSWGAAARISAD